MMEKHVKEHSGVSNHWQEVKDFIGNAFFILRKRIEMVEKHNLMLLGEHIKIIVLPQTTPNTQT